ncbi:PREDICTED: lebercilin [Crocodylus porosus]|uniref:Lebercilin LCA5 n=1 Tax=Crocodylus porosus TaxID=8502 RepID=A0A7M4FB37_CROPO|nr:PREDICTED: lebercilin [Crocodylus porosus]XP_019393209.1 PREDICTED: lebercilin [Crocodylus porosus]
MGERPQSLDSEHERKSDADKNSDSYYSDEDNASHSSDRSPMLSCSSMSHGKKNNKIPTSNLPYQASKKLGPKYAPSKRGTRWGFRSQSLNRDSPAKDVDLVTKRVLSARLLKINELRNELTELHIKLDELQKENRALKRLQYRQEKALNKFEDTENEISQLLARHNNEVRILRERLRKSQERERTTERRLKDSEDELYRTKNSLQKLKKLSEDKHLVERDELAKKLALAENKLEDNERRIKDLEKNLELSNGSFQRQLHTEKKKVHEAQEENRVLLEELRQLNQKLKEKERELEAKNIYANRMVKPSPKKDTDVTHRKKGSGSQSTKKGARTTKGVQTSGYCSPIEFPPPPEECALDDAAYQREEEMLLGIEQETQIKEWKEQAELLKHERNREREEKMKHEQELQALEEKVQKLHDEWEKEELDRRKKESNFLLDKEEKTKMETEIRKPESERQNSEDLKEEQRKKQLLLDKMNEIDRETQNAINMRFVSQAQLATKSDFLEKTEGISETTEKVVNGFSHYDSQDTGIKAEGQKQQNARTTESSDDLTFGSYVPSFAKASGKGSGKPNWLNQKSDYLEKNIKENKNCSTKKEKKSNLMEQLFGTSASSVLPSNRSESSPFDRDWDSSNVLAQDKGSKAKVKEDSDLFFSEGRSFNPNRLHLQHTASRPAVKAVDSLEDDIEEPYVI